MNATSSKWIVRLVGACAIGWAGLAVAQQQEGLVNVNVSDNEILEELNLNAPVTVQAPIGVAANVCGIDANVLASQRKDDPNFTCEAETTTEAFNRIVSRQTAGGGGNA